MKKINSYIVSTSLLTMLIGANSYASVLEIQNNDTFLTSQIVDGSSPVIINGSLSMNHDYLFQGSLTSGTVDYYSMINNLAGQSYVAAINNFIERPPYTNSADTIIASLDEASNVINTDDDSSPYGDDYASMINGKVNADGTINLAVSAYPDYSILGDHTDSGDYDLFVSLGDTLQMSDVDFFTFNNLTSGSLFTADIFSGNTDNTGNMDTILGLFDETGTLIDWNDDNADLCCSVLSKLTGIVPDSGLLTLAISGFGDEINMSGLHSQYGDYSMSVTTSVVPVPSAIWLFGSGMLGLIGLARRK